MWSAEYKVLHVTSHLQKRSPMLGALQRGVGYTNPSLGTTAPCVCSGVSCALSGRDHFCGVDLAVQETLDIFLAIDCIASACDAITNITIFCL